MCFVKRIDVRLRGAVVVCAGLGRWGCSLHLMLCAPRSLPTRWPVERGRSLASPLCHTCHLSTLLLSPYLQHVYHVLRFGFGLRSIRLGRMGVGGRSFIFVKRRIFLSGHTAQLLEINRMVVACSRSHPTAPLCTGKCVDSVASSPGPMSPSQIKPVLALWRRILRPPRFAALSLRRP